jgi:hypothetical protein
LQLQGRGYPIVRTRDYGFPINQPMGRAYDITSA